MEVVRETEGDVELFARNCSDEAVAIPLLEKIMSPQLAKKFFQKYTSLPWVAPKFSKMRNVPKLTDICCSFIGKNKHVIDTLFAIYGADTNFPIPNHLVDALTTCRYRLDDHEASCKLTLLLINMNASQCNVTPVSIGKSEIFNPMWNELIWKKLQRISSNKIQSASDYSRYPPKYSLIDVALPYMTNFRNVHSLSMPHIFFKKRHILQLAKYMPELKSLGIGFKKYVNSSAVINALAKLRMLEELRLDFVKKMELGNVDNRALCASMEGFISECLGAMPQLKIAGTIANDVIDIHIKHIIPTYDEPTELALEHLVILHFLEKECANSCLPNVKYLRIIQLEEMEFVQEIVDLGLSKLEELHLVMDCHSAPIMALITSVALTVSVVLIADDFEGGLDFLRIIDLCPNLNSISLFCVGGDGYCTFGGFKYQQQPHPHLKEVTICVDNKTMNHQLPSGALARILCAPHLKSLNLDAFKYPDKDCHLLISKMQSGCKILQKLNQIVYSAAETSDIVPVLFATMATFCPKLRTIHCDSAISDNEVFKMISPALLQVISLECNF